MSANVNLETGIRFGIIAANSLDPEVVNDIQMNGKDVHWEEAKVDISIGIKRVCGDYMSDRDADDVADLAVERMSDHFEQDEPVHEFDIECPGYGRVKGRTTWLGGALMVWIFESPFTGLFRLCSPCVPGACDLDSPVNALRDKIGEIGYDVPADWRSQPC